MEVYVFPLSRPQKRLWYQEIIQPENIAYNIPIGLRFFGELNQRILEKVFQTIVNRHEILRTTFATENGEPMQLVHGEMVFHIEQRVIESSVTDIEEVIKEKLAAESRKPFNLVTGPLIRAILYKIQPQEHILFVNMHHIVSDGWSLGVFVQELTQLYTAYLEEAEIFLPELPIQYGDYAEWQENWLQEDGIKKQLANWEKALAGLPQAIDLPLDFSRPMQQTYNGAMVREYLPLVLTNSLEELAKQEGATFFMAALAVYQVLLYRYSNQTDIIVGSAIANRRRSELDNLIGYFVNTLALRADLSGKPSFRDFLGRISRTCLDAYANQDVPFETLVEKLSVKRDPSRSPIFQTLFVLQNAPLGEIRLPGLKVNPISLENGGAKFDLTLILEASTTGWLLTLEYNTDLLKEETARRILKHYQQLLAAVVSNPDVCINSLSLLTPRERQELLELSDASNSINCEETNLVELFAKSVVTYPNRIAVTASGKTLTYRELDQRSDRLASFLRRKGVCCEVRVGIYQERNEELIVSLLAVLKAGGTYVPLDPAYPAERIIDIVEDSNIALLLAEEALLSAVPPTKAEVVVVDKIEFSPDEEMEVCKRIFPAQAAYIIYTSGSTGKPKGCVVTHGNVTRLMRSTEPWFEFNENDVWTLFHSYAFDFSVWEIWGALVYGGKLVVVPYLESRSPETFRALLLSEGVTILNQTPSAFRSLIRADREIEDKLNLRAVIFGGEALELQSLRPWIERYGDESPRLINMYGITETTVHVTYRPISLKDIEQNRGSVIGEAIPDLSLYVLDEALEPTPIGVPGEIYVGGMGVSRGYLNRAKLTVQRFIPDPYSKKPGARLYCTGDIARRLPNGDLEYLGRGDEQVKVRGFRIELGEIEAALAGLPEVAEAVVVTHSENAEDKRLVAYIVVRGQLLDQSQLRAVLKERLPDYMIPAAFIFLDAMPLTAQGKINRKALPAPNWNHHSARRAIAPGETPAEKIICQVWEQVLEINLVGVEDNFFELGGDSILALKVVTELRRQGWELTPKDIFQQQTVKLLAQQAKTLHSQASSQEKAFGEAPLSPIQKWFFELEVPNPNHWNQTLLLEVSKSLKPEIIAAALRVIAAHHDIFRLRFQKEEGIWRQFYTEDEAAFTFEVVEQVLDYNDEVSRLQRSLDLRNGPLARVAWLSLGEESPPRLLIVVHHLIVDGISWRILTQDLATVIAAIIQDKSPILENQTTSFKDWSEFLQSFAKSSAIQKEKQFWLNVLKDETARLPLDFPKAEAQNFESSVRTISRKLTKAQTNALLTKANKAYRTQPQELLLAAVSKTISNITKGHTIQILMEGHGREEISPDLDITNTLGWFTTLYPLRLDLSSSADEGFFIKGAKEKIRSVPQRGIGYSLLKYLQSEPITLNCTPEISFNYLGQVRDSGQNKLFRLLNEDSGLSHDPEGLRPQLIEVLSIIVDGELQVDWLYSANLHQEETVSQWADNFQENLLQILTHCNQPNVCTFTPSDFPLVPINQSFLDVLQVNFPNLEDIYPLSPLQEGMLFHTLYSPEDGVYFEQVTGKITGGLDIGAFAHAWQVVVDRHPILRTAFVWENQDTPVQVVSTSVKFPIQQQDWRNFSTAEQEYQFKQHLAGDRKNGFQLDKPPLMRFTIIQMDDVSWQWVWSHHHILLDGWSIPLIFKEVLEVYKSKLQGVAHSLTSIPPYRNYIQWLASQDNHSSKQFWREQFADLASPTPISWELEDTEVLQNLPDNQEAELRLSDKEFTTLQQMAQNCHLTLNTLTQGAWALLLQKYGAGQDVLFGVTVSGRPPEITGVEKMVGLFINTLPMRVALEPSLTVASWLEKIQQHHVRMREYEYSKLTDIQKEISLAAGESLFESILVFENYPVDQSLKEQGEYFRVDDIQFYERTNYPLTVGVVPDRGLRLKLNYQTKFLSATAAKTLLSHLRNIIINLAEHPDFLLGKIQALSAQERDRTIDEGNANAIAWGDFRTAHQLFENWADLHPNAVALVCGDDAISYGELEKRTNQLAATLISTGIGYESIVGLYFHPDLDFIIALLAVLKAGAAFLPLDRSYPETRLQFIVEDSQTRLILAKEAPPPGLFPADIKVIIIGDEEKLSIPDDTNRPNLKVRPENLAYIIYTSGSTGKPKGVLVSHAGIQNLVRNQTASFGVTAESRVYQFASLNFDAAISEIFMALGSGATLYLQEKANRSPSPALWQALTNWQITHVTLPPSLLAAIEPANLPQLQTMIVAGEAASGDLLCRWGGEKRACFNAYGPTEATVCASLMNCSHLLGEPSIGKAIANVEIYLLDSFLEPVPLGITGEIYIGGISLARGYLHRPSLTAEAFIPHPFAKTPGARLYKTGDRGVYDLQGNIRFKGRQDAQVKFNGYRIELGEIEAALTRYATVESAVVLLRQDMPGRNRIVAYALTPKENPPTTNELQDYLTEVLPAYMIPSAVVLVTQWPLTPNGKIDRQALPAPEIPTTPTIPKTQTEEILAQVWIEVLGLETVNPDDNFFHLGGDSIVSLRVTSGARKAGLDINPRDIFETQTLRRLAAVAKPLRQQVENVEPLTASIPLAPIQRWFFEQNLPHPHHWNQAVALSASEPLNIDALGVALRAVVAHHDILRSHFRKNQSVWEQSYFGSATKPPLRIEDFSSHLPSCQQDVLQVVVEEEQRNLNLESPPLLRVLYAKNLEEYGNVVFLFGHHLVFDGVSWRILIEDLTLAYQQAVIGKPISLPGKTSSYRQWATSLETLANSREIAKDVLFWQETLSSPSTSLPVDDFGSNTVDSLSAESTQITAAETQALLKEATAIYHASVQEILLTALLDTLSQWNGSPHVLIDLEGHGREILASGLDLSRTVGWFTSLYPVLLKKPSENPNRENMLKEMKRQMRAIPHHGQSFGLLRYLSQEKAIGETLANTNKAQISFNYLGQIDSQQNSNNLFNLSNAPTGSGMFGKQKRPHLLAVNARIQSECMYVDWTYSKNIHHPETIRRLAESYLHNLRTYLKDNTVSEELFYTASDFRMVEMTEDQLDSLLADLEV
ncbi:amino acid adenylation domain-containing protein [Nostoc sp.]|uniref:amino acid adenylation domain-containing protein n=1 Tax=Nostoc sp. TaxID=1180 RepID=UPI002FFB3EB6